MGWLLLRAAVVLQRTVASKESSERWQVRRNAALRGAHRRGMTVEEMSARTRLSEGWLRQVVAGRKPPEPPTIEEAA